MGFWTPFLLLIAVGLYFSPVWIYWFKNKKTFVMKDVYACAMVYFIAVITLGTFVSIIESSLAGWFMVASWVIGCTYSFMVKVKN